ncbi:MAG: hypothetical protein ACOX19_05505 [Fermentimonas sp.]|jgi:hypothetical protein
MKHKLSIFVLLALLVAGCTDDINLSEPDVNNEVRMVTISANMSPETRVSYTENQDNTITVAWESTDKIMLVGYDADGTTYLGKSIFTKSETGNQFSGLTVAGATYYKAFYPADAVKLDTLGNVVHVNGIVPLPGFEFWEQTQVGDNTTGHINKHLFMSDETAGRLITDNFQMEAKSSVIKFVLTNIPTGLGTLTKVLWKTEEELNGYTHWAAVNISGVADNPTSLTAYLAFPPCDMVLGNGGRVKIMLVGKAKSYEYISAPTSGKTYLPGKRYTATVNMNWSSAKSEFTFAINPNNNTTYNIKLKEASVTVPAELTIYWGEGTPQTIPAGTNITNGILATHLYQQKGERIITIYSADAEPTNHQMPQLTFNSDQWLTTVLTPFPNFGPNAKDFSWCFYNCQNLVSIPAGLFHNNTLINNFSHCCDRCTYLYIKPGLFPPENSTFFANRGNMDWSFCFNRTGEKLANAGTAPPLWTYTRGGNTWTYDDCFKGATSLTNYSSIPASWGGGLAGQ